MHTSLEAQRCASEHAYDYESITHLAGQCIQKETQIPLFWYFSSSIVCWRRRSSAPWAWWSISSAGAHHHIFTGREWGEVCPHFIQPHISCPKVKTSHPSGIFYNIYMMSVFTHFTHITYQKSKYNYPYPDLLINSTQNEFSCVLLNFGIKFPS